MSGIFMESLKEIYKRSFTSKRHRNKLKFFRPLKNPHEMKIKLNIIKINENFPFSSNSNCYNFNLIKLDKIPSLFEYLLGFRGSFWWE
jgi:hypothetical protein